MSAPSHILNGWLAVATLAVAALVSPAPASAASPAGSPAPDRAQLDFFESKVRPVLADHCYKCHSARSEKLKGGLHVDTRDGLLTGGDSGPSIVPGDPEKSRLIEAIRYKNEDTAMPPKNKLPDAAIRDLEAWVKMGAPWPAEQAAPVAGGHKKPDFDKLRREHWAYQPLKPAAPPAVKDAAWPRNDVDKFVLAKLESKGLAPVADADRAALVRRAYFDLIGLPPTPEQIDAFVNDTSPNAFEKLVDQLLASPHFGERWGRHWLDVARYGESLTLRGFVLKDTWKYRDYVIDTFNKDRPFDRFMQEQVAGDLMPAATTEERARQMTGTTFLAMGNTNLEEQDKKQLRMDVVDEQLDTIGKAFLAQTIGCARCHDHKFDPITSADYYGMAGILRNAKTLEHSNVSKWLEVPLPADPATEAETRRHEAAVAELTEKVKQAKAAVARAKTGADVLAQRGGKAIVLDLKDLPGVVVDDAAAKRVGTWKHSKVVGPYFGEGYLSDHDPAKAEEKTLTFQPELPRAGRYEVRFAFGWGPDREKRVPVTVFSEDDEKTVFVNQSEPPLIDGQFVSLGVYPFEKNGQGYVRISNEGTTGFVVADVVQFVPVDDNTIAAQATEQSNGDATPATTPAQAKREARLAAKAAKSKKPAQENAATTAPALADASAAPIPTAADIKKMEDELKRLVAAGPKRSTVISVVEEKQIGDTQVHVRGIPHNLGPTVPRGYLSCVPVKNPPAIPADQSGRLQLGQWLAAADNPLPARVMANRVWHWLMGQGIVRTVDNFGTTGEQPSHPELLEHLAAGFAADDWSVKRLVRKIVLSRAYQLSTANDANAHAADPENRLRWRMDRRRLDAECIRDAMLAAGGTLDLTPGGQTFKPGVASDYNYKQADTRRSVYSPVFRNALPELFEAFDFADPSMVVGRRTTSTVAPQALYLMNNPFPQEQAKSAATKLLADTALADDAARLSRAFRLTLGREPTSGERRVLGQFLTGSETATPAARQAAWAQVVHALFASTDFRYVN